MSDNNGWGGQRLGAGRKPAAVSKKNRSFYLSDAEYDAVKDFLATLRGTKVMRTTAQLHLPKRIDDPDVAAAWFRRAEKATLAIEARIGKHVQQVWEGDDGKLKFQVDGVEWEEK